MRIPERFEFPLEPNQMTSGYAVYSVEFHESMNREDAARMRWLNATLDAGCLGCGKVLRNETSEQRGRCGRCWGRKPRR